MKTMKTILARALLRLAIAAAPADQAEKLRETDRLIWRPKASQ